MSLRIPFFGLLVNTTPMEGLVEHYDKIAECITIINDSIACYVTGGSCREMEELSEAINQVEDQADRIKRRIRNHLPRRLFMAVDKTLFLQYTTKQDNILDSAQSALEWLAMRHIELGVEYQRGFVDLLDGIQTATSLLGPALHATIALVNGTSIDRDGTKETFRKVRLVREEVQDRAVALTRDIYTSDMDFKDIYQLMHFVSDLNEMSHNCASCVDMLRAMIAR
ncbi:MAG: DUF47 domain-containing protein [Desulfovibrionaceae bacterium]